MFYSIMDGMRFFFFYKFGAFRKRIFFSSFVFFVY